MKTTIKTMLATSVLLVASAAHADWHSGKIQRIFIAYDGSTITFQAIGHTRNNCTCYAAWPDTMCLNRDRTSFKEEVALLYMARARGSTISYNIDEATCQVVSIYESD